MNIQLSVIVWTVICFLLLMLILKTFLFTPVLKVLDSRKERIAQAQEKKAELERVVAENEKRYEKEKALYIENKRKEQKQLAQKIQSDSKKEFALAQRQGLSEVKNYRESITDEYDRIVSSVAPKMETAAAIFAKNIISHRI